MKTTFYLIRHGETDWNVTGRWQGHADVPLNEIGRTQARRLAERIRRDGPRFDALYSSDLQRAWETASMIAAPAGLAPQPLPQLREIDVGSWSGLTGAEVRASDSDAYERIQSGEDLPRGGGERFLDLYARVVAAVERLAEVHAGQRVALVTHGGAVRAVLLHAARDKQGINPHRLHIGNTAITIVFCGHAGWGFGAINDMAHLEASPHAHDMTSAPPDDTERP
ncbi:histidine phosphatase family protein [Kouleothrix sp.]|uniref:histidine phosphatase family protein n=1 Tax=Kouleothrix sp. TaxID=2779161 RepID=UPI00391A9185